MSLPMCKTYGMAEEIFKETDSYKKEKGLEWKNCVSICTDGARDRVVTKKSLERSSNTLWNGHTVAFKEKHWFSKPVSDDLKTLLNTALKILNYIKTRQIFHKYYAKSHKSLLLQTDVSWLSRGKVLARLVEFLNEVTVYLERKNQYLESPLDEEFILKLTYLVHIFSKLNIICACKARRIRYLCSSR